MDDILKIKVSIWTVTIELEGKSVIVISQLNELREKGLAKFSTEQYET